MISIREAKIDDLEFLAQLFLELWNNHQLDDLKEEVETILESKSSKIFVLEKETIIGFCYLELRYDYVEGTSSSPVGYLEGIYLKEHYRNLGYAQELLKASEIWLKKQGCSEFASDCEIDNIISYQFHLKNNFLESNRIICFTKKI